MPAVQDIEFDLDLAQVEQLRGIRGNTRLRPRIQGLLPEILGEIRERNLIAAAISYQIIPIDAVPEGRIELHGGTVLETVLLARRLAHATGLAAGAVTIGGRIGETISQWFSRGWALKAALLEEIANALLFRVSDRFQLIVYGEAQERGLHTSGPLSPGDEGFGFDQQGKVLELAQADTIGISLSNMGFMVPVHSTSVVVGLGHGLPTWTQADNCQICRAREKCAHRHEIDTMGECLRQ